MFRVPHGAPLMDLISNFTNMFRRKKLLIIVGPTGCGKTTFRNSLQSEQKPDLAKSIIEKAFSKDYSYAKTLRMKGLRRHFRKRRNFRELTKEHFNFILELDTTCPVTIDNLMLLPSLLDNFDRILVVHLYTPFKIWIKRIRKRRLEGFKTSEYVNQILRTRSVPTRKSSTAQRVYLDYYSNFEHYFNSLGAKDQMCINTIEPAGLSRPYPFDYS